MSYQVVARKWRPQRFDEVVGQDHITETLKYAVVNKRIAPVYLFTGIRGTGKTTLARIMVKSLNCLNPEENGEPCNSCENCLEIIAGRTPDVIEIDGASNNSVDDVRNIKENITYSPVKSKYKIYIIDEVHMLSKSAFNALLKTLEEPPAHTIFILATTDPQKIPTTVLSRCQRYDLKRLSMDSVVNQLIKILDHESIAFDKEALYQIAREGEGSMRDSQTVLEQLITFGGGKITGDEVSSILGSSDKEHLRGIVEAIVQRNSKEGVRLLHDLFYSGRSIEKAAKDILHMLHFIVLFSELNDISFIEASDEEKDWIMKTAKNGVASDWVRLFRFWNDEYERIKMSDFSLMIFEVAIITAASFPQTADFSKFINLIKNGSEIIPEPVVQDYSPIALPEEKKAEVKNWVSFIEKTKSEDKFLYGAVHNLPFSETDKSISLAVSSELKKSVSEVVELLEEHFKKYFDNAKDLVFTWEETENISQADTEILEKKREIEEAKEYVRTSEAVKEFEQLGFGIKKISAE